MIKVTLITRILRFWLIALMILPLSGFSGWGGDQWYEQQGMVDTTLLGLFLAVSISTEERAIEFYKSSPDCMDCFSIIPAFNQFMVTCPVESGTKNPSLDRKSADSGFSEKMEPNIVTGSQASCFITTLNGGAGGGDDDPDKPSDSSEASLPMDDICPICQAKLDEEEDCEITHCCGKIFHIKCLQKYQYKASRPNECPHCRAPHFRYVPEVRRMPSYRGQTSVTVQTRNAFTYHYCPTQIFTCHLCPSLIFSRHIRWEAHLRSAHQYCWLCPVEQGNNYLITEHYLLHQPPVPYMCAQCSFPASCVGHLQSHVVQFHKFYPLPYDCQCFGYSLTLAQLAERHMSHFMCSICLHILHQDVELEVHLREHLLFKCTRCLIRFPQCELLEQHQCQ